MAANIEGRREIIGMGVGPSKAETFWMEFLRSLKARGLHGVKLVISDAHSGLNPRGYTLKREARYGGGLASEPTGFDPRLVVDLPTPAPREDREQKPSDPMSAFRAMGDDIASSRSTEYPREGIDLLGGMEPTRRRPR